MRSPKRPTGQSLGIDRWQSSGTSWRPWRSRKDDIAGLEGRCDVFGLRDQGGDGDLAERGDTGGSKDHGGTRGKEDPSEAEGVEG